MIKRIDIIKRFLDDEDHLYEEVCPFCYQLLRVGNEDGTDETLFLYCANEMCCNEEHYKPERYISPFRYLSIRR